MMEQPLSPHDCLFLRRHIRSNLYLRGGGAASGPEGPPAAAILELSLRLGSAPGGSVSCFWATVSPGRMSVIDHVRDMAAAGLHSNVRLLSSLLLTMSNNNP